MPIIVNSVPKSGTHLVEKALRLLGVSTAAPLPLSSTMAGELAPDDMREPTAPIGVGMPIGVSVRKLHDYLRGVDRPQVITGHVMHSPAMQELLQSLEYRMFLALRDPRDVAVSLAFHIAREESHRLHEPFTRMTPEEQFLSTIRGVTLDGRVMLESIGRRFGNIAPWLAWERTLAVRFEDLVGPAGGGDDQRQLETLRQIAAHAGVRTGGDLATLAGRLFGNSITFRKGTTGQWREHFQPVHHAAFEEVAPGLLSALGYPER